jgi:hypothetical protein
LFDSPFLVPVLGTHLRSAILSLLILCLIVVLPEQDWQFIIIVMSHLKSSLLQWDCPGNLSTGFSFVRPNRC